MDSDRDYDDDNITKILESKPTYLEDVSAGYDSETIDNLITGLSNNQQQKTSYLKTINNKLNSKKSFKSIFETEAEIGIILENDYSITNFQLFIDKIMDYYILFKWKDLPLIEMDYKIQSHCISDYDLSEWNHYIKIENFFTPITFDIEQEFNNINTYVRDNQNPFIVLSNIIDNISKRSDNNTIYNIQRLLKNSLFHPLIKLKYNDINKINKAIPYFETQINTLTTSLLIKTIEQEFDAFLGCLIIFNYNRHNMSIPLNIFLFSCESNDNIIFFIICKIDDENVYNDILYTYVNRNNIYDYSSDEEDNTSEITIKQKKKKNKNKNLIQLTPKIIEDNSTIRLSRLDLTHIDDSKLIKDTPLWKMNITNSIIRYISYGYIGTEFK